MEKLKSFTQPVRKTPFFVSLAGITYPDANYCITRKTSGVNVIEYVLDGEGFVWINGREHKVTKDTIYMVYKGEYHKYYANPKAPFTKIFLNITGDFFEDIVRAYGIMGTHFFDGGNLKPKFEKIFEVIFLDISDSEKQAALQGIFLEIAYHLGEAVNYTSYSEDGVLLKRHLDKNIRRLVSTEELSEVVLRSKDYCLKLFKNEFGITPYAYQIENKMKTAKNLLANTNMTVGEIAENLGYSDVHYFSNLFLSKCGIRPIAYRKSKK